MESLSAATSSTMTSACRSPSSLVSYHGHHVLHRHLVFVVAYSSCLSSSLTRCVIQNEGVIGLGVAGSQFALFCNGRNVLYKVFVSDGFQDRSLSALGYTDENRCTHSHNPPLAQFGWTHAYGEKREDNDGGKTGWTVSSQRVGMRLFDYPYHSSCAITQIRHVRVQQARTRRFAIFVCNKHVPTNYALQSYIDPTATHVQQTRQKTTTFRPFPAGPSFPRGSSSVRAFRPWRRPSCRDRAAEPPAGPAGSWGSSRSHPPSTRHRQPRRRR